MHRTLLNWQLALYFYLSLMSIVRPLYCFFYLYCDVVIKANIEPTVDKKLGRARITSAESHHVSYSPGTSLAFLMLLQNYKRSTSN